MVTVEVVRAELRVVLNFCGRGVIKDENEIEIVLASHISVS